MFAQLTLPQIDDAITDSACLPSDKICDVFADYYKKLETFKKVVPQELAMRKRLTDLAYEMEGKIKTTKHLLTVANEELKYIESRLAEEDTTGEEIQFQYERYLCKVRHVIKHHDDARELEMRHHTLEKEYRHLYFDGIREKVMLLRKEAKALENICTLAENRQKAIRELMALKNAQRDKLTLKYKESKTDRDRKEHQEWMANPSVDEEEEKIAATEAYSHIGTPIVSDDEEEQTPLQEGQRKTRYKNMFLEFCLRTNNLQWEDK